jgi:DNA (cytosine-5)-methyltransferase 1
MSEERRPTCGSLFAGIGGGDLGLERAGWDVIWQVELDPWRRKVLERHWPTTLRWDDIQTMPYLDDPGWKVDLIIGGFPCQDLSVAGKRAGLKGERSGLFFDFMRVAAAIRPRWLIVENVPGLLSSHEGQDMGIVLETLSECGYGLAWRILDSQYFGVPQRRRRVYIVGHLGAPCPPEILFEPEGGGGDSPAGGKAGEGVAHALRSSPRGVDEHTGTTYIAAPLEASDGHHGRSSPRADGADNLICAQANPDGMRAATGVPCGLDPCSRCPDGRRYAALGDAMTVNVIKWIGRRLLAALDV